MGARTFKISEFTAEHIRQHLDGMAATAKALRVTVDDCPVEIPHEEMDQVLSREPYKSAQEWAELRRRRAAGKNENYAYYPGLWLRALALALEKEVANGPAE